MGNAPLGRKVVGPPTAQMSMNLDRYDLTVVCDDGSVWHRAWIKGFQGKPEGPDDWQPWQCLTDGSV